MPATVFVHLWNALVLQLQKCRMEPEAPKLGSVSEAAGHPSLSSSSALKLPLIQTQEHEVPEAPKFKVWEESQIAHQCDRLSSHV